MARIIDPIACRETCHEVHTKLGPRWYCKGARGPLTREQIAEFCYRRRY